MSRFYLIKIFTFIIFLIPLGFFLSFDITFACDPSPELICNDGIDNDCNGSIDCLDVSCNNLDCDSGDVCRVGKCIGGICTGTLNICGGLVPCGREANNPTTAWDDRESCNFCHGVMLISQGMNFLVKIAGIIAVLAIIITGFLFVTSAGDPERKNNAKTTLKWIIFGFLILFLSWLIADFILTAWGYLDPLGGQWSVVCD